MVVGAKMAGLFLACLYIKFIRVWCVCGGAGGVPVGGRCAGGVDESVS